MTKLSVAKASSLTRASPGSVREPLAWKFALVASLLAGILLVATSNGYGYFRDELYFRMLSPAWGYVDQPPLTPWLARMTTLIADEVWALRLPSILAACATVFLSAVLTRELGGGQSAQRLAAVMVAASGTLLMNGHILLTQSIDHPLMLLLFICVARAQREPRWWAAAGCMAGLITYNRWLVVVFVAGVVLGSLLTRRRRPGMLRWMLVGAGVGLLVGMPNLFYQAANGWPQLRMGAALSDSNADSVRQYMIPLMFFILSGVPLFIAVIVAIVSLVRGRNLRDHRWILVVTVVITAFTYMGATQFYYPSAAILALLCAGSIPLAAWMHGRRWRVAVVLLGLVVSGAKSAEFALPLAPVEKVSESVASARADVVIEQIGWPTYVEQIAAVHQRYGGTLIASNFGEAGALDRFGADYGLPRVYSGHNQLWFDGMPPDNADTAVIVGPAVEEARSGFATCQVAGRLDNHVGVQNREQGREIWVCSGKKKPWSELWPSFYVLG